jgi:hypothetical protein
MTDQNPLASKVQGKGLGDLVAMLSSIRPQDADTLRQEAEALACELLALAAEPPTGTGKQTARALTRAARTLRPGAEISGPHFLQHDDEEENHGGYLEEFLTLDLMGLGCQIAAAASTQQTPNAAQLLRLSGRLMAAAGAMVEALDAAPERDAERMGAWLQLATVEGLLRRFQALLTQTMEGHAVASPRNDEDRWATAAVILSGSLSGMAEVIRVRRAKQENDLAWDLHPQGWIRLVVHILRDSAERIAPTVEGPERSPHLRALLRLAEVWERVAEASDGQTAMERASMSPPWERVWREADTPERSSL